MSATCRRTSAPFSFFSSYTQANPCKHSGRFLVDTSGSKPLDPQSVHFACSTPKPKPNIAEFFIFHNVKTAPPETAVITTRNHMNRASLLHRNSCTKQSHETRPNTCQAPSVRCEVKVTVMPTQFSLNGKGQHCNAHALRYLSCTISNASHRWSITRCVTSLTRYPYHQASVNGGLTVSNDEAPTCERLDQHSVEQPPAHLFTVKASLRP